MYAIKRKFLFSLLLLSLLLLLLLLLSLLLPTNRIGCWVYQVAPSLGALLGAVCGEHFLPFLFSEVNPEKEVEVQS